MRYDHVLITGATGAVGAELLIRILSMPRPSRVTVLMRGETDSAVRIRFADFVTKLGSRYPQLDPTLLSPVRGDVTRLDLGLAPPARDALTASVDAVVHSAADTRLEQTHESAQRTNRLGTTQVLRFASACRILERLVHVSTAYVSGSRTGRVAECELNCGQSFLNSYECSKFEAETEVRARMADLPVTIVRPSIVVGDSRDGHQFNTSAILPVLRQVASGRLRAFPGRGSTKLDLVPVDYVADALHFLLGEPQALGGTYHLVAGKGRSIAARRLFETTIREVGRRPERPIRFSGRPSPAGPSLVLPDRLSCYLDYLLHEKDFDNARFRGLAGLSVPPCPPAESYLPLVLRAAFRGRHHRCEDARGLRTNEVDPTTTRIR